MRRTLLALTLLLIPQISTATPLTAGDLTFIGGVSIGEWGTLGFASTNGASLTTPPFGNGARIVFDQPFTGTWSFEYRNIELWPIRINCEPCFDGPQFYLPLAAPGLPEFLVPFTATTRDLVDVTILNFAIGGAATSTLFLRNMVFQPAGDLTAPPAEPEVAPVPEPATVVLLGGGLGLAALRFWRRRSSSLGC